MPHASLLTAASNRVHLAASCQGDGKLAPAEVFYQVVLSFLADDSLEQAMIKSDELKAEAGEAAVCRQALEPSPFARALID